MKKQKEVGFRRKTLDRTKTVIKLDPQSRERSAEMKVVIDGSEARHIHVETRSSLWLKYTILKNKYAHFWPHGNRHRPLKAYGSVGFVESQFLYTCRGHIHARPLRAAPFGPTNLIKKRNFQNRFHSTQSPSATCENATAFLLEIT